jgi:hypothetical protein
MTILLWATISTSPGLERACRARVLPGPATRANIRQTRAARQPTLGCRLGSSVSNLRHRSHYSYLWHTPRQTAERPRVFVSLVAQLILDIAKGGTESIEPTRRRLSNRRAPKRGKSACEDIWSQEAATDRSKGGLRTVAPAIVPARDGTLLAGVLGRT